MDGLVKGFYWVWLGRDRICVKVSGLGKQCEVGGIA